MPLNETRVCVPQAQLGGSIFRVVSVRYIFVVPCATRLTDWHMWGAYADVDVCVCFFVYLRKLLILIDCCVMRCALPRRTFAHSTFGGNTSTRERPLHMQPDDRQTGSEVNVLQLSRAECSRSLSSAQLSSAQFCWALLGSALIGHSTDWPGVMPSLG